MGTFVLKRKLFGIVRVQNVEHVFGKGGLEKLLGGAKKTKSGALEFTHEGRRYYKGKNGEIYLTGRNVGPAQDPNRLEKTVSKKLQNSDKLVEKAEGRRLEREQNLRRVANAKGNRQVNIMNDSGGVVYTYNKRTPANGGKTVITNKLSKQQQDAAKRKIGIMNSPTPAAKSSSGVKSTPPANTPPANTPPVNTPPTNNTKTTTNASTDAAKKPGGFFSNHPVLAGGAVVGGGIMAGSILQDHNDRSSY